MFLTELTDLLQKGFTVTFYQCDEHYECALVDPDGNYLRGAVGDSLPDALAGAIERMMYLSGIGKIEAE